MTPRLYIDAPLSVGAAAPLTKEQAHYLKNVLRRVEGDAVLVFNERDGEFEGAIAELSKKGGLAALSAHIRAPMPEPDLWLLAAPVKRGPFETIVQKATEVGARKLLPVVTERTTAPRVNVERLQAIAIEATEQCGRLAPLEVRAPAKLDAVLEAWPATRTLIYCDEAGDDETAEWGGPEGRASSMLDVLNTIDSNTDEWGLLIGPEGGFSPSERARLRGLPSVAPVTLGPRILRADTAAIAALALFQAARGDWR